jgi:hypothetical protein
MTTDPQSNPEQRRYNVLSHRDMTRSVCDPDGNPMTMQETADTLTQLQAELAAVQNLADTAEDALDMCIQHFIDPASNPQPQPGDLFVAKTLLRANRELRAALASLYVHLAQPQAQAEK